MLSDQPAHLVVSEGELGGGALLASSMGGESVFGPTFLDIVEAGAQVEGTGLGTRE